MGAVARHVHVLDAGGDVVYNQLMDTGDEVLAFRDGHGFITRHQAEREGWAIVPGWLTEDEMDAERARRWAVDDVDGTDMDDDDDPPPVAERGTPEHIWYADAYGETRQDFLRDEHEADEEDEPCE